MATVRTEDGSAVLTSDGSELQFGSEETQTAFQSEIDSINSNNILNQRIPGDSGWTEPESAATVDNPPQYPYNNSTQTESGHLFELDDTPKRERIRLNHRTGTFIEMHPNGDEVHKVYGDGYEITVKNKYVLIKGVCNLTIEGDSIVNIKGNKTEFVEGNYSLVVKGDLVQSSAGKTFITSDKDMTIGANPGVLGTLNLRAGDHLEIAGDLNVSGQVTADIIFAETRVDTGPKGGMKAGLLGFVSSGGLSIGLPGLIAIPGTIICGSIVCTLPIGAVPGTITAATNMVSPLAEFGMMTSILMTDVINSTIFDTHIHPAPKGVTGPTFSPFMGV